MKTAHYVETYVGAEIPSYTAPPITRHTLALYCGASGDHNPLHVDIDFAMKAGLEDVIAHGMLSMAYVARMLTDWMPQCALRNLGVRFMAMTHVGDELTCSGIVQEKYEEDGEQILKLQVIARNANGETKLQGEAVVFWCQSRSESKKR